MGDKNKSSGVGPLRPGIRCIKDDGVEDALRALLSETFEDGSGDRLAVPVLGAGLNKQAAAEAGLRVKEEEGEAAEVLDWGGLLEEVEKDVGIAAEAAAQITSMTARWEAVVRLWEEVGDAAHQRESALGTSVKDQLQLQAKAIARGRRDRDLGGGVYQELLDRGFRDMVTLNFTSGLLEVVPEGWLEFQAQSKKVTKQGGQKPGFALNDYGRNLHFRQARKTDGGFQRLWQAHGSATERPDEILLGVRRYGLQVRALDLAFGRFKEAERAYGSRLEPPKQPRQWSSAQFESWRGERRQMGPFTLPGRPRKKDSYGDQSEVLSWLDVFLMSPLVFVGCGLSPDEFPLWWALHQRARNQLRVPSDRQMPAVVLWAGEPGLAKKPPEDKDMKDPLGHLRGGPAGVCTVLFESHADLWDCFLGRGEAQHDSAEQRQAAGSSSQAASP